MMTGITSVLAEDKEPENSADMALLEFVGEGVVIDNEYVDPLRVGEYGQMINDAKQEVKQQNE